MAGQARILSAKEISGIFKVLPTTRDRAIFAVGIYTGLRVGEVVSLRADQLFTEVGNVRHVLKVKRAKKKNTVFNDIPIHPKLKKVLADYHDEQELGAWLFPSGASSTGHLTRAQAHNILSAGFENTGAGRCLDAFNAAYVPNKHESCRRSSADYTGTFRTRKP